MVIDFGARPDPREVERLVRFYEDAQRRIAEQLMMARAKGNSTKHLEAVRANIRSLLADLEAGSQEWVNQTVPKAYLAGVAQVDKQLAGLVKDADFAGIHTQAAQILADNTYSTFAAITASVGRQTDDYLRAIALDAITSPLMGGKNTAASDIFTRMVLRGDGVLRTRADGSTYLGVQVTPNGKWWDMQTYAEMSARTTLADTMRAGTQMRLDEAGVEMFIIVGGEGDSVCDICQQALDAGPMTRGEIDDLIGDGLFHPNCTHSVAADPSALDALREEIAAEQ